MSFLDGRSDLLAGNLLEGTLPLGLSFFRGPIGTQPQRDVLRLQRLAYNPRNVVVERLEVRFVAQPGGEGFEGLSRVVLAPVEAAIDKRLDAAPQRVEQCRYHQGRYDDS